MILLVGLVILVAAVASITRLAVDDDIAAPWRIRLREKYGDQAFIVRMLECTRCTGVWVSHALTAFALGLDGWYYQLQPIGWLFLALLWIPTAMAVAYLAFVLYLRGEA